MASSNHRDGERYVMSAPLYVINPNSLAGVTAGIQKALAHVPELPGIRIECLTLDEGPAGILSQYDADQVIMPLCKMVERLDDHAAGFVIACFGDPGLHAVRERTRKPVLGIGESSILCASQKGQRIGVIAVAASSIPRHLRIFSALGLFGNRVVAERAVGLTVAQVADPEASLRRLVEVGRQLRDVDGADVVVLGCAGMAYAQSALEDALGIPVVEPCRAAVGMALGRILTAAPTAENA